jgi:hypothetical protein
MPNYASTFYSRMVVLHEQLEGLRAAKKDILHLNQKEDQKIKHLHLENSLKEKRRNELIISSYQHKLFLVCRVLHSASCFS